MDSREGLISKERYRINEEIQAAEVRVIGPDGDNLGVLPLQEALRRAAELNLDLVEVAPNATPPVARILNFGKFIYEQEKKERQARKAQKVIEVKEIRLRPKTNEHHLAFKVRDIQHWLEEGNKVKVRVRFFGREASYPEIALEQLRQIAEAVSEVGVIEQAPIMDNKTMLMVLAPKRK